MNAAQLSAMDARLSVDNAAVLLVDHQAGLLSLVQDYSPDEFKNNVLALKDLSFSEGGPRAWFVVVRRA